MNKKLLWIILIGLIIRFSLFFSVLIDHPERARAHDTRSYDDSALALAETGRFDDYLGEDSPSEIFRSPGYPLFLAGFYKIFGFKHLPVVFVHLLIGGILNPILLYVVSLKMMNRKAALIAALFITLDPNLVFLELLVLSETVMHTFILLICFYSFQLLNKHSIYKSSLLLGVCLIVATFIRPVTYYLPLCLMAGVFICNVVMCYSRKEITAIFILVLLVPLSAFGLWKHRNQVKVGTSEFCGVSAVNMLHFRAGGVHAIENDIPFSEAYLQMENLMLKNTDESINIHDRRMQYGMKLIFDNPIAYFQVAMAGIPNIIIGPGVTKVMVFFNKHDNWKLFSRGRAFDAIWDWLTTSKFQFVSSVYCISFILILNMGFVIGLIWYFSKLRNQPIVHLCFIGMILYFLIISAGPEAYARFRVPFTGLYAMFSAYGIVKLWDVMGLLRRRTLGRSPKQKI